MLTQDSKLSSSASKMRISSSSPQKRSRDTTTALPRRTRTKLSPPDTSSGSSASEKEDAAALIATSRSSASTGPSDVDAESDSELSESSSDTSSEEESSEESSSEEEDEEEEESDENEVVNVIPGRGKKPDFKPFKMEGLAELKAQLDTFLPQLAAANEELERERKAGTLKDRDIEINGEVEGEYIEMDLGLGVLEHKDGSAEDTEMEDKSEDGDGQDESGKGKERTTEKDILGKLMRQDRKEQVGIQEVDGT